MASIRRKTNDTGPSKFTPTDEFGATVPLTAASSVVFIMRDSTGTTVIDRATATVDDGKLRYDWQPSDVTVAGVYSAEFEVTWNDSTVQTFPTVGYITVILEGDLG